MKVIRDGNNVYVAKNIRAITKREETITIYLGDNLKSELKYENETACAEQFEKMIRILTAGYNIINVLGILAVNFGLSYLFVQLFK